MYAKVTLASVLALGRLVAALPQATEVTTTTSTTGTPIGALSTTALASSVPQLPPDPAATIYPRNGQLNEPQPAPYVPAGGLGTNGTEPNYQVRGNSLCIIKTHR